MQKCQSVEEVMRRVRPDFAPEKPDWIWVDGTFFRLKDVSAVVVGDDDTCDVWLPGQVLTIGAPAEVIAELIIGDQTLVGVKPTEEDE